MWCGLCGFLIIKQQTALHHAVWCGEMHYYLRCGMVMPFWRFWYGFCGLCGLMNTPRLSSSITRFGAILCLYFSSLILVLYFYYLLFMFMH